jgi:hypothetical protein
MLIIVKYNHSLFLLRTEILEFIVLKPTLYSTLYCIYRIVCLWMKNYKGNYKIKALLMCLKSILLFVLVSLKT